MSEIVRVALYTRISTDETNQPYSLGAQRDRLEAFVASQPDWVIVERYTDQASGKSLKRPALAAALAGAAAGSFDVLLVYRLDRLSRSLRDVLALIEDLCKTGVGLRSATESFDTATPAGRMLVSLLGTFAEFERSTMLDRISAGMERKASRGEWTGGRPPFGYRKERGESLLLRDPDTAPIVASIFARYVQSREGAHSIAAWLDATGVRTRGGARWGSSSVLALLRNRAYVGQVSFRGVWRPSPHEPIVDRELFDAAAAILASRAASPRLCRSNPTDYLLSTLRMVCQRCGHPMVGTSARGRGGKLYTYYTCTTRAKRGPTGCDQERLPKDELERAILAQMTEVYADTSLVAAALDEAQAESRAAEAQRNAERERLRARGAELRRKLDRYLAGFESGELRAALLQARVDELAAELASVEAALEQAGEAEPEPERVDVGFVSWSLSKALGDVLATGSPRLTKELLRILIAEIRVVSPTDIRPTYRVPQSEVRILDNMVGEAGVEPAHRYRYQLLRLARLPFRHSPTATESSAADDEGADRTGYGRAWRGSCAAVARRGAAGYRGYYPLRARACRRSHLEGRVDATVADSELAASAEAAEDEPRSSRRRLIRSTTELKVPVSGLSNSVASRLPTWAETGRRMLPPSSETVPRRSRASRTGLFFSR